MVKTEGEPCAPVQMIIKRDVNDNSCKVGD
jgi:hypothetical protein